MTLVDDAVRRAVDEQIAAHARTWDRVFGADSLLDPEIKDVCVRFLAQDPDVVAHADDPEHFDERARAAMAWAVVIGWDPDSADDALFERLRSQFTDPQLVELGTFIALVLGRQNWLRTLEA